jgi:hypothetical protein
MSLGLSYIFTQMLSTRWTPSTHNIAPHTMSVRYSAHHQWRTVVHASAFLCCPTSQAVPPGHGAHTAASASCLRSVLRRALEPEPVDTSGVLLAPLHPLPNSAAA